MTVLEQYIKEYSVDDILDCFDTIENACPSTFGYEARSNCEKDGVDCVKCWCRQYVEVGE